MKTSASQTVGNTLDRARQLVSYIGGFKDYQPPRNAENPQEMQKLLGEIITAAAEEAAMFARLQEVVNSRVELIKGSNGSLLHLIPRIRAAVESQYGKSSVQAKTIGLLARKIQPYKKNGETPPESTGDTEPAGGVNEPAVPRSRSTRSFGTIGKTFLDVISSVKEFGDYKPGIPSLDIPQLELKAAGIDQSIQNVNTSKQLIADARNKLQSTLTDLRDRTRRIKACVKAQYGSTSEEYLMIRSIRI